MNNILQKEIIKELGLLNLPGKEQEEALLTVGRIIFQAVLIRIMEELLDEKKDELEKIITESPDDEEKIMEFLQTNVPKLDEIVKEEIINFKKETLDLAKL